MAHISLTFTGSFIFLNLTDAFGSAANVSNIFAMICFLGVGALILFRGMKNEQEDKTKLYIYSGLILFMCLAGLIAHIYNANQLKESNQELLNKIKDLEQTKEQYLKLVDRARQDSLCCSNGQQEINKLGPEVAVLKEQNESLTYKLNNIDAAIQSYVYGFAEGFATVKNRDGKWGYLRKGSPITSVDFRYDVACRFYNGRAGVVCQNGKWGFVDQSLGKPFIPCEYEEVYGFQGDSARVKKNGEWFWISKNGKRKE